MNVVFVMAIILLVLIVPVYQMVITLKIIVKYVIMILLMTVYRIVLVLGEAV